MKVDKVIKTAIKYAPLVYPVVKKLLDERKKTSPTSNPTKKK